MVKAGSPLPVELHLDAGRTRSTNPAGCVRAQMRGNTAYFRCLQIKSWGLAACRKAALPGQWAQGGMWGTGMLLLRGGCWDALGQSRAPFPWCTSRCATCHGSKPRPIAWHGCSQGPRGLPAPSRVSPSPVPCGAASGTSPAPTRELRLSGPFPRSSDSFPDLGQGI